MKPSRGMFKLLGLFGSNQQINSQDENKENSQYTKTAAILDHPSIKPPIDVGVSNVKLESTISKCEEKLLSILLVKGIPGLVVCVAKQNKVVWNAAFGYCDVENQVMCSPDSRMRIASISKSIFAATVVAPLIDKGLLDIKSSIYKYIKEEDFPRPKFQDKEYDITIEQLLSHTSGIRGYADQKATLRPIGSPGSLHIYQAEAQFKQEEFFERGTFRSNLEALKMFKDSPLVKEPGNFLYTTYGYTLLSAVIEQFLAKTQDNKVPIEDYWMRELRNTWNLRNTTLDHDEPILPKRARYYMRSGENGSLINAPYANCSYKWAGGGLVSTTKDLAKFGIALIDSFKSRNQAKLSRSTIDLLWKKIQNSYGLGFKIIELDKTEYNDKFAVSHTGSAVGASSILVLFPESELVVTIICNLHEVDLTSLGLYIAQQFERLPVDSLDEKVISVSQSPITRSSP